jgi:tagatose-1,6-bisphosphate aldolase
MTGTTLDVIADSRGKFAVLAMDQRSSLRRMLTAAGRPAGDDDMSAFKVDVIETLSPLSSGTLTDVEYGVGPVRAAGALADGVGLLIAAEPAEKEKVSGEYLTATDPRRDAAWVKANTGDAMKFLLYWNPDRPVSDHGVDLAQIALDVVAGIVADCSAAGIPSVIEPLVSFAPGVTVSQTEKEAAVVRSATRLAAVGMDLLKLEWPGDAQACAAVSGALGSMPWALLSAGVAYEQFVERTRIALDNGASGFIAGRAIWGEAVAMAGEERRTWLAEVAVPRLRGLTDLLADHGRGWREATA